VATDMKLTEQHELFLELHEQGLSMIAITKTLGVSRNRGYVIAKHVKDVILDRARDKLILGVTKAADTMIDMMDADASTEKGELRLKASESLMNRVGITSHTSVEVMVESENGIFILPGKTIVPEDPDAIDGEYTEEDTP